MGKSDIHTTFNFREVRTDDVQIILYKMNTKQIKVMTIYFYVVSEMTLNIWQVLWLICLMKLSINIASQLHIRLKRYVLSTRQLMC